MSALTTEPLDRRLLAGAVAVWIAAIAIQLASDLPLKHDEAAFVVGARRWWDGAPTIWLYRSMGTEVLVLPAAALGLPAALLRLVPALLTLLVPLGGAALARAAFPQRRLGGWTAAVLAGAHPMLLQVADAMSDLPAAGMILVAMTVLVRELSRPDGPSWRLVTAALPLAAAFYVRYGSAPALAAIAVGSLVYAPAMLRRPGPVVGLVAAGVALAMPYVAWSYAKTGTLMGVLEISAASTRLEHTGEGLGTYLTANPFRYYGAVVAPVIAVGAVAAVALRARAAMWIGFVAVATLVALGLRSHAQPRYAFAAVALLVVPGVAGLAAIGRRLAARSPGSSERSAARWRRAALAVVIAAWLGGLVAVVMGAVKRGSSRDVIVELAEAMRRDAAGGPCAFVALRAPQLTYYSGCLSTDWPDAPPPGHRRVYYVSLPGLPIEAPAGAVPLAGTGGRIVVANE